jgi:hypothetical protein
MFYINPYDIANRISFKNLTSKRLKEFKELLLGLLNRNSTLNVGDKSLSKSEIMELIKQLEQDSSLLQLYKSTHKIAMLNSFLNGEKIDFKSLELVSRVLKLNQLRIVKFLEPYILDILNKEYNRAYLEGDSRFTKFNLKLQNNQLKIIYRDISRDLNIKKSRLRSIKKGLKGRILNNNNYIDEIFEDVSEIIGDVKRINSLTSYFAGTKSELAKLIRDIANKIASLYQEDSKEANIKYIHTASKLMDLALSLNINFDLRRDIVADKDELKRLEYIYNIENELENNQEIGCPVFWLDSRDFTIKDKKPKGLKYGIHITNNRTPMPALEFHSGEEIISPIKRPTYLTLTSSRYILETPTAEEFIEVLMLFRRFILEDREGKEEILINKMGFDKIKTELREKKSGNFHYIYIYPYSSERTNLEFFLYSDRRGTVTEINRFNQSRLEELKIPLDSRGILYSFMQVYGDMNGLNFDEFKIKDLSEKDKKLVDNLMDFKTAIPDIDEISIDTFPIFWKK